MDDAFASASFSPPDVRFRLSKHGDHEFVVDGDPTVDQLADMLRIENVIRTDGPEEEYMEAAKEGRDLVLQLIQEKQPDVTELRIGGQELTVIFSLIMRGSSVAEAVANAILAPPTLVPNKDASNAFEHDGPERADDAEPGGGAPLASPNSSTERSSLSAEPDDGLPATGTG